MEAGSRIGRPVLSESRSTGTWLRRSLRDRSHTRGSTQACSRGTQSTKAVRRPYVGHRPFTFTYHGIPIHRLRGGSLWTVQTNECQRLMAILCEICKWTGSGHNSVYESAVWIPKHSSASESALSIQHLSAQHLNSNYHEYECLCSDLT